MPRHPERPAAEVVLASYYSDIAKRYEELWCPILAPLGARLVRSMSIGTARLVLDVGTGTGGLLPALREHAPEARIVGVDRSAGMLQVARSISPNVGLGVMDAQRLALASCSVDAITLAFVLFHMPQPLQALKELARVLRPGGRLGLTTWAVECLPGTDIWDEELDAAGADADSLPTNVRQHGLVDREEKVTALLRSASLAPVHVSTGASERQWTPETLLLTRIHCGSHARRLRTLTPEARAACIERLRERLSQLTRDELAETTRVVFAVAETT